VTRYQVERGAAKAFPAGVQEMFLGFRLRRLVEVEIIYNEERSRDQGVEKVAGEYALLYGESKRSGDRFWWADGKTVLRVFPVEVPASVDGAKAVAWRTAVQVFDHSLFERGD
jgi:hypothetical protein